MVQRTNSRLAVAALIAALLAGCSGGGSVTNAAPRISSVPAQSTNGGSPFTLDLATYVADRESATASLTYAVVSGGGSFTGTVYSQTFDAMGSYTVQFSVADGAKTTTGSFVVNVTSSNFVVVKQDNNGLFLLDSATNGKVQVTASAPPPSFAAGLADGRLVYQQNTNQLWIFDPMTRTSTRIGGDSAGAATYRAKTSDSKIVYTTGTAPNMTLFYYNPVSGYSRQIDDGGLSSLDVMVNSSDLVFYEVGVAGQSDVYYYDAVEDDSFAVAAAETDEQLLAVLGNGGVVLSRVGGSGETDLFYYRVGTGLVEIGADVGALATRNKTYNAKGSASQVVFTATNAGNREILVWDPATGQTATAVAGTDNVFDGIGDGNEVVYHRIVSGTEHDIFCYDIDTQVTVTVRDSTDLGAVLAVTTGSPAFAIVQGSGLLSSVSAVSLVASPATVTWAAGGTVSTTVNALDNGDVVAQRADGTGLNYFDVSLGIWGTPFVGVGLGFAGPGLDDGDFIHTITLSSQVDLVMWDSSAATWVAVSVVTGNDAFAARTENNTILFTRVVVGNTTADLFSWNGTAETQLTTTDSASLNHDHTVLGQYAGSR